jgi:hypothetical protein
VAQEDLEAQPVAEAIASVIAQEDQPVESAIAQDDVSALAAQLANLSTEPPLVEQATTREIAPTVPGVATSLRPVIRPANFRIPEPATAAAAETTEVAVTTTVFPAGTNLVQLGAFPSPALAAQEWDRLQGRFGQLMAERGRVIQVSNQSSATWYRLRASGIADRAEARRLCAALQAEGAECIAVLVN